MAGTERGFLEMLPPRDPDHRYMGAASMRDFWRSTSDRESLQEMQDSGGRGGRSTMPGSMQQEHSYGYSEPLHPHAESVVTMEVVRSHHVHDGSFFTEYHPAYPGGLQDSTQAGNSNTHLLPTYTNFFHASLVTDTDCDNHDHDHELKHEAASEGSRYMASPENHYRSHGGDHGGEEHRYPDRYNNERGYQSSNSPLAPPVAIPMSHDVTFSTTTASECIHRDHDMETLRRELAYKCSRSGDLLMAITRTADAAVREHGSATSGVSSDDEDAPDELEQNPGLADHDQDLRAAIVDHPYYPEMVVAHIRIFKIGAPRELRNKLDDITKKFQRFQDGSTMSIGDDPSLDFFMRSYVDLLAKLGEDLEEPFHKFMQFKDATTKALENICGHYIETGPDESDNYGFDIGPIDGAQDSDELDMVGDEGLMYPYGDVDESIVVDPNAPDEELRKVLMMKYGRHIGGLKAEFNRVRKKGKLPSNARSILKDWFNRHSYWPYPSEVEKQHLQRICNLNLKQINNWFINERKRHWSCEGKCMHPNAKFYNNSNGEGKGHLEHME